MPFPLVDKVIPVRDLVIYWATVVAERYAAIHTARTLAFNFVFRKRDNEFVVIF
jgi:hypothetical protein